MALTKETNFIGFNINEYVKIKTFTISDYLNEEGKKEYKAEVILHHYSSDDKKHCICSNQVNLLELQLDNLNLKGLYEVVKLQFYIDWSDC